MELSEVADAPESVPDPGPPAVRRSGRTTLLIAAAAVLGVVAGTCTGYVIQAGREPTALPPLSQPVLAQAKGKGPEPLSAAQDDRVRTDGDLRAFLLKRPSDAQDPVFEPGHDGWMSVAEYAETFNQPANAFSQQIGAEFRRAAVAAWRLGDTCSVEIHLVQYRQEEGLDAIDSAEDGRHWAEQQIGSHSWAIPGTEDGRAYVHTRPDTKFGVSVYSAEAHAWRGDIAMEIWIYDTKPISKEKIMDLAKRQVGRL